MSAKFRRKETAIGYLFLAPALIGFVAFMLFPFLFSLVLSFAEWDLVSGFQGIKWVGLANFRELFAMPRFYTALKNNLIITLVTVPVALIVSLVVAYVLNELVYMKRTIRLLFFVPYISNVVAVSIVWKQLFRPLDGPINQFLAALGVQNLPQWLTDGKTALVPIMVLTIWMGIGYDMIIYMAALQNVPRELYEAGAVDGAVGLRRFIHITMPMLSPTTYFLIVTRVISSFQIFSSIKVMTEGGPGEATTVLVYEIYREAFRFYRFGTGSAIAWILFLIIFAITLIQTLTQDKWVTYA